MFGHQVIDDMKNLMEKNLDELVEEHPNYLLNLELKRRIIQESQHFHISDIVQNLGSIAQKHLGTELFWGETADVRLPYESCWFDAMDPRGVRWGMLTQELDDLGAFLVTPFHYYEKNRSLRCWYMSDYDFWVSPGVVLSAHPRITNFLQRVEPGIDASRYHILKSFADDPSSKERNLILVDRFLLSCLNVALLLLSCVNIKTEDHPPSKKVNHIRTIKHRQPLFTYKTLVIKSFHPKSSEIKEKGLYHNRIHLARGHFKSYTKEAPLFGKITGRWWWQAHVRGQNKDGVVIKDYVISPTT